MNENVVLGTKLRVIFNCINIAIENLQCLCKWIQQNLLLLGVFVLLIDVPIITIQLALLLNSQ